MEKQILLQIILSLAIAAILGLFFRLYRAVVAAPRHWRRVLKQQGIEGPPPAFWLGNILELKKQRVSTTTAAAAPPPLDSHNSGATIFPVLEGWRKKYGDIYMVLLGTKPMLVVNKYDVVKEVTTCTSLHWGKPSYQAKEYESLLGDGVITSNGEFWAHQRKILAPELFFDKVKGMTNLIQESTMGLIDSWKNLIDAGGGKADIKIDDDLRKFSGDVISKACFGSTYDEGKKFFDKLKSLQRATSQKSIGIPGMRYIPTKKNMRLRVLQKEVKDLILKLVEKKNEEKSEKNMLRMILEGAKSSNRSQDAAEKFTIDNCKNIYLAGYETTAIAATWCLMLLSYNQEWQDRVRDEVIRVCDGGLPDSYSINKMKQLTMVINETMRLYPPAPLLAREALSDLEFAGVRIPKGVGVWVLLTALHTDPEIWGPNSYEFKPERFANGAAGAYKLPHLFMPFGLGPRVCLGLNLAMVELKILLALLLSNFSFTLSPKYVHDPVMNLVIEPLNGVNLVIEKLKLPTHDTT